MSGRAHVLVAIVVFATLAFLVRLVRQRELRAKYSMLWLTVGSGLALFASAPSLLDRVSAWLGISYPPATLLFLAVMLLLMVSVHFSWEISRLEEKARTLAEALALHAAEPAAEGHPEEPGPTG